MSQPTANKTLNVTWDDHLQNLSGLFQDLYENKKLCDVTLYCSGGTLLKAHKIVLSACSPYFSKIFQEIEIKHPVIILKGVTYDEMHQLLEFMYKGSINILEKDLASLIQAGSYLEIKGMDAKNIPTNIKNNLKRSLPDTVDENIESAKKLKDINHEIAKITEQISRDSSPASTSRRETRFKGQKRVDVRFRNSRSMSTSSPLTTSAIKKKDIEEEKDVNPDQSEKNNKVNDELSTRTPTKGKSPRKSVSIKKKTPVLEKDAVAENKNNLSKTKSQPEKIPNVTTETLEIVKEAEEFKPEEKMINETDTKVENSENGGVANLVIKDVYSTGEFNLNENSPTKNHEDSTDENYDEDEIFSELDDDTLVIPDVSFKETDGEIVTQSDDEAIQNPDVSEHLHVSYMECSYCSMTFKNDNDLFCHQKVHTETKPFKCDFCDTFFQRSSHLARHRRKHIGDRPYECKTCGKAFSRSDKLRTHCRQTHDDDYKPPAHLKKKYEFVEFTGDILEKKGRGRPRKFPMKEPSKPSIDGQKRGRGRPRKMSCPAPGEPVENYDITNLPFGDFSYLTEAITLQAAQPAEAYHDISIIPVANSTTISAVNVPTSSQNEINDTSTTIETLPVQNKNKDLLTNIRQIGECTIQPVAK